MQPSTPPGSAPRSAEHADARPVHDWFPRRRGLLPVVLVATFMAQFDLYVVNVALPVLRQDLGMGSALVELVVSGYAFAYAAGLIAGGRLGDHYGHRRLYVLGMAGFGVASLACGLADSGLLLVVFRLAQGLAAAAMVPQVLALISSCFPPQERARALSWFGVTIGVGAIAGQVVGGLLLQADVAGLRWRTVFLINVPIAGLTLLLAGKYLPARTRRGAQRLDVGGILGLSVSLGLVLVPLTLGHSTGWPWWCWLMLLLAAVVLPATLAHEARTERSGGTPIVPLVLFKERAFTLGLLLSVLLFGAFFSLVFCLTMVLQDGIGLTPLQAGLTFAPLGISFAVASIAARGPVRRHGGAVIVSGAILSTVAMAALTVVAHSRAGRLGVADIAIPLAVVGLGNGTAVPAVIGQVLTRITPAHAGAAAGVLTTAQQFSSALGIAVVAGVFFGALGPGTTLAAHASALTIAVGLDTVLMVLAIALAGALARSQGRARS